MSNKKSFGVIPSQIDKRDYKLSFQAVDSTTIPKEYSSPLPPFDKNQGETGICTNASISRWFERQFKLAYGKDQEFSMTWLYAHKPDITSSGAQLRDILKLANSLGNCKNEIFPYIADVPEIVDDLNKSNQIEIEKDSSLHKVKGFAQLTNDIDIKLAILNYSYVYVAIPWFSDCEMESIDLSSNAGDYENIVYAGKEIEGYHAILIYGWDSYGWRFVNTWGNGWSKDGCAVLDKKYPILECWSLLGAYKEPQAIPVVPVIDKKSNNEFIQVIWKIINTLINMWYKLFK